MVEGDAWRGEMHSKWTNHVLLPDNARPIALNVQRLYVSSLIFSIFAIVIAWHFLDWLILIRGSFFTCFSRLNRLYSLSGSEYALLLDYLEVTLSVLVIYSESITQVWDLVLRKKRCLCHCASLKIILLMSVRFWYLKLSLFTKSSGIPWKWDTSLEMPLRSLCWHSEKLIHLLLILLHHSYWLCALFWPQNRVYCPRFYPRASLLSRSLMKPFNLVI